MKYIAILIIRLALQSCKQSPDLEMERKAILVIHEQQQKAHIEKNVDLLLSTGAEDYIEINRGLVNTPSYDESFRKFQSYFERVDFVKWEDVSPPVISFSDDATMATSVVKKLVITRSKSDNTSLDTTRFAWLAVFKKVEGQWKLHRMGSTNQ